MTSRSPRALVLACLLSVALAGAVSGHAELIESDPADGETIETPATLTATFSTELDADPQRSRIIVRDAAGAEVARGFVTTGDPTTMAVELPALPAGQYAALWQAYDPSDDHIERGTITFSVAEPAPSHTPSPTPAPTQPATGAPPTSAPTDEPTAETTSSPSPAPSPNPQPSEGEPTAGTTDILLALGLAGVVVGGLAVYLLRRR
ncbi:MAG TPA: copper resistance protein CopC [Candidatus Limnocylindria bacterium]|nr:copper resistance protein CopC [Candidatus Limnocylindria bacterium]